MAMKKSFSYVSLCVLMGTAVAFAQAPKPKRINKAIELLEQGQPIYYTGSHEGTSGSFEQGKRTLRRSPITSAMTWSTLRSTSRAWPIT